MLRHNPLVQGARPGACGCLAPVAASGDGSAHPTHLTRDLQRHDPKVHGKRDVQKPPFAIDTASTSTSISEGEPLFKP